MYYNWRAAVRAGPGSMNALKPAGARALMDAHETFPAMAGGLIPKHAELVEGIA